MERQDKVVLTLDSYEHGIMIRALNELRKDVYKRQGQGRWTCSPTCKPANPRSWSMCPATSTVPRLSLIHISGNFLGLRPTDLAVSKAYGVELDSISGRKCWRSGKAAPQSARSERSSPKSPGQCPGL